MPSAYPPETETRDDRQVERRLERALSADFEIQNLGPDPVFSVFAVKSPSGRTYEVTIRHLTERANRCSCPDFRTNLIGTCKHIEAVLVRTHRPAEYRDRLSPVPAHPQIYLHYGDDLTVRVIRPMNIDPVVADLLDRYFDCDDLFRGDPARDLGSLLETAPAAGHVDISSDVYEQLRHLREAARWNAERHRYLERLEAGEPLRVGRFELRGYQNRGVVHLATTRLAVLADENGLGKSVQAIGAVELLRRDHGIKTALVI